MLRSKPFDSGRPGTSAGFAASRFVVYVEGPSDCYILRTWAHLVSSSLARQLARNAVILGGRRPARAVSHFTRLNAPGEGTQGVLRGICVLDRDDHAGDIAAGQPEGLE